VIAVGGDGTLHEVLCLLHNHATNSFPAIDTGITVTELMMLF
jgi:diacylglycerol kinase family enzyme